MHPVAAKLTLTGPMKFMSGTARPTRLSPMRGTMRRATGLTSISERKLKFRPTSSNGTNPIQPVTASCSSVATAMYSVTFNPAGCDKSRLLNRMCADLSVGQGTDDDNLQTVDQIQPRAIDAD